MLIIPLRRWKALEEWGSALPMHKIKTAHSENANASQAAAAKSARVKIPEEQMDLPVGFNAVGDMVTLREAKRMGSGSVLPFASLTPERRAHLTIKRIEAQPTFEIAMLGAGMVDKTRAVREIGDQTEVGRALTEIEQRVIHHLLHEIGAEQEKFVD